MRSQDHSALGNRGRVPLAACFATSWRSMSAIIAPNLVVAASTIILVRIARIYTAYGRYYVLWKGLLKLTPANSWLGTPPLKDSVVVVVVVVVVVGVAAAVVVGFVADALFVHNKKPYVATWLYGGCNSPPPPPPPQQQQEEPQQHRQRQWQTTETETSKTNVHKQKHTETTEAKQHFDELWRSFYLLRFKIPKSARCNIQYAVDPMSSEFRIIEVNARHLAGRMGFSWSLFFVRNLVILKVNSPQ